jgi:hypothetical protein
MQEVEEGGKWKVLRCGSGMFIPDPGSSVKKIPDPGSASASNNLIVLTQKIVSKLGNMIRDPGSGVKKAPDSGPGNRERLRRDYKKGRKGRMGREGRIGEGRKGKEG